MEQFSYRKADINFLLTSSGKEALCNRRSGMAFSGADDNRRSEILSSCTEAVEQTSSAIGACIATLVETLAEKNSKEMNKFEESFEKLASKVQQLSMRLDEIAGKPQTRVIPLPLPRSDEYRKKVNELEKSNKELGSRMEQMSDTIHRLQRPDTRMGRYRVFAIRNPLQLMSDSKMWESPVVELGGTLGYRCGLRVFMAGDKAAQGKSISVYFYLTVGPYDEWLRWPFPDTTISLAMFRKNGCAPHETTFKVNQQARGFARPDSRSDHPGVGCPFFIEFDRFLDDANFLYKHDAGPDGKDDILLVGFAIDGEEALCHGLKSELETRLDRIEPLLKMFQELPSGCIEMIKSVYADQRRRSRGSFDDDVPCC